MRSGDREQGTRFLDVHDPQEHPAGRLLPPGERLHVGRGPVPVYTADAYLGIEVLRIDRKADSTMPTLTAPVPASRRPGIVA